MSNNNTGVAVAVSMVEDRHLARLSLPRLHDRRMNLSRSEFDLFTVDDYVNRLLAQVHQEPRALVAVSPYRTANVRAVRSQVHQSRQSSNHLRGVSAGTPIQPQRFDADLRLLPLRPLANAQHGHAHLGGFPQLRDRMLVQYRASRKHDVRIRRLAETKLPIYSLRPPQIGLVEEVYAHLAVQAQLDDVDQLVPQRRIGPEIRGRLRGEAADGPDDRRGRDLFGVADNRLELHNSRPSFSMPCHRLLAGPKSGGTSIRRSPSTLLYASATTGVVTPIINCQRRIRPACSAVKSRPLQANDSLSTPALPNCCDAEVALSTPRFKSGCR